MSVDRIIEGKNYFVEKMQLLGFTVLQSHGNFVHVKFGQLSNQIHRTLKNKVLYRLDFEHISLRGYSRFTVAPIDIMKKVTGYIAAVMEKNNEI